MLNLSALMFLISHAELIGSRGYARKYGEPEPAKSDYDWAIFTDDATLRRACRLAAEAVAESDSTFRVINRHTGFTLHSKEYGIDVNVMIKIMRKVTRHAWSLIHAGYNKRAAWAAACAHHDVLPT